MKVRSARIYRVEIDGRRPVLLQLFTDEGITGVGEATVSYGVGSGAAAAIVEERYGDTSRPRMAGVWPK